MTRSNTVAGAAAAVAVIALTAAVWASVGQAPWERGPEAIVVERVVRAQDCREMQDYADRDDVPVGERMIVLELLADECL